MPVDERNLGQRYENKQRERNFLPAFHRSRLRKVSVGDRRSGGRDLSFDSATEGFVLLPHRFGHPPSVRLQKVVLTGDSFDPFRGVHLEKTSHDIVAETQTFPVDTVYRRRKPDRSIDGFASAFTALQNPLQHADIVSEPRPDLSLIHI